MAASGHIIANKHVSLCCHNAGQPRPQGLQLRLLVAACDCRLVAADGSCWSRPACWQLITLIFMDGMGVWGRNK